MAAPPTAQAPVSLYVGDLHPSVTEDQLQEAFSVVDNLLSVRLCKDSVSGGSLGYGYVNFPTIEDANHAIEKMNHTTLNGKVIRIMWSQRDSEARKSGIGNLFVKNLDNSVDNTKLHGLFSGFGNILSCKLAMTLDGKTKGYGFVQFESEDSANTAIKNVNGITVGGKKIYVGNFVKKSDRVLSNQDAKYTNLYIKNLDEDVTDEFLREKFSEFGKITNLAISKDMKGNSSGFGFVNFESPDDAKRAMEAMDGIQFGSKVLYVARAQKKAEREQMLRRQFEDRRKEKFQKYKGSNVYVKNINDDIDEDKLREHFSQCGTIISVKLMRDDKGISKGFGFVCFSTPEEANKAVSTLHGCMFHQKPLYVAIAQRKEDRQEQLRVQFAQHTARVLGSSPAVIPAGYSPIYYTPPPGVVSQIPARQGLMYQPFGPQPGWRPNGFAPPTGLSFQPMPFPMIPSTTRQRKQNSGMMNGHMLAQGGGHSMPFMPHMHQPTQSVNSHKEPTNHQAKHVPNEQSPKMSNGSAVSSAASNSVGTPSQGLEMLAAASPLHQKHILGTQLFPLVQKLQYDLASKITRMLLQMDNSELLLLLESPDSLAIKVDEAVQVLKLSKSNLDSQEVLHPNYLSSKVAVN